MATEVIRYLDVMFNMLPLFPPSVSVSLSPSYSLPLFASSTPLSVTITPHSMHLLDGSHFQVVIFLSC